MLNICLIGAGGVGTIAAYVLENSHRAQVTAVLRSNYTLAKEHGFDINSVDHGRITGWKPYRIVPSLSAAYTPDHIYDFIVITTKALPDLTASLIQDLTSSSSLITPQKTTIVLIQNGLDIEAPFTTAFPSNPILSSSSLIGSRLTSPTTIFHEDPDISKVGPHFHHLDTPLSKTTQLNAATLFVELYNTGLTPSHPTTGAECILVQDITASRWRKLLWNASFNPLCTLLRISVGELLSSPGRSTLLEPAMREVAAVATAAGFGDAVSEDVVQMMLRETSATSPFRPSMLVDLENGRMLELDMILGAVVRVAREERVDVPVLGWVFEALRVVQWGLVERSQGRRRV
ncbi:ketopantoate reductase PanE/ApbA C terminal-domain-containing protein [Aspergillus cavernicola]|uniref:2-dehydropantoate 2-reductase n=1 Tax=Aspergillus cavernicola TaxID=176166 RepID=A0ABR4J2N8_9EURO